MSCLGENKELKESHETCQKVFPLNKQIEAFLVNAIDQAQHKLESNAIKLLKSSQRLLWKGFVDQARAVARQAGFLAKFEKQLVLPLLL